MTPLVLCAIIACAFPAEGRSADTRPVSPSKVTRVDVSWGSSSSRRDTFSRAIRASVEAILSANENRNSEALLDRISDRYRGACSLGGILNVTDLENSLRCDYEIFDSLHYSARVETVRITRAARGAGQAGQRQAEVVVYWTARARLHATGQEIVETGRRTRLVFIDETGLPGHGQARVILQNVNGLRNGAVLFGRADRQSCAIRLRADAGSQTGAGTFLVTGTSAAGGESVTPTR